MTQDNAPTSALDIILDWSMSKPIWQRDALRRIVINGSITDNDFSEVMILCKRENGLGGADLLATPLERKHLPTSPKSDASVQLSSLDSVVGVNQIAPNQRLEFELNGLTIIYGGNGAGKSGYARVLKKACRARYPGKIISNVFGPSSLDTPKASIEVTTRENTIEKIYWEDSDHPHDTLSAISIFDRDCANVHVRDKTSVAFRPFGLDIPHKLASLNRRIKDDLTKELEDALNAQNPIFLNPSWSQTTAVGSFLSSLTAKSDINILISYGSLTDEQVERMNILSRDLQKDPKKVSSEHRVYADAIKRAADAVQQVALAASNEAIEELTKASESALSKRTAADIAAKGSFSDQNVQGVGTDSWRILWEAARSYSKEIAYPESPFPPISQSRCVLCHTLLDANALERMNRFEKFILENVNAQAVEAEDAYNRSYHSFFNGTTYIHSATNLCSGISFADSNLSNSISEFLNTALSRHSILKNFLDSGTKIVIPDLPESPVQQLVDLENRHRKYADQIEASDNPQVRNALLKELEELKDRRIITELLPSVQVEISRLKRISSLQDCMQELGTRSITSLGNRIADEMITPQIQNQFRDEIARLVDSRLRVRIVRSGGEYGSPQYQIQFIDNPHARVYDILSEGELGSVAIAAFFTELATASHRSALVFDDPVSSLDHHWRDKVAKRLVEEVERRQVVVFSHDLVFINDIMNRARDKGIDPKALTLTRGPDGTGVVEQGLPWDWGRVRERIEHLKNDANIAKKLYVENNEREYREVTRSIYSKLRATWERAIEDIAFSGVVNRHSDYINTSRLMRVTALSEHDCLQLRRSYKKCSELTEAHDPSRGSQRNMPFPDEVHEDIEILDNWVTDLAKRQNRLN